MKKVLIFLFVVLSASLYSSAQVTLLNVDFETAGSGYTPSTASGTGYEDIFNRTNQDLPNTTNEDGYYWAMEDFNGNPSITLDQINVTGYSSFTFSIDLLAHHYFDWDLSDEVQITYSIDGGAYQNLMWIESINDGDAFNSIAALDSDFDGDGECANKLPSITTGTNAGCSVSSSNFANFSTSSISLSGNSTLDIKIDFIGLTSNDEGIYMDNILVQGITSGPTITTSAIAGSPFCVTVSSGYAIGVNFTSTGTFNSGNIFTAQLSDASGSFTSPTNIGTLSSTLPMGIISALIPAGTPSGSAYRIRVVANNPSTTGSDNGSDLTIVLSPQDVTGAGAVAGNGQVDVVWTNPAACYDEILVVAKAGSVTATPSGDGSAYTDNTNFGAGTNLGAANYCVYKGTGNSVTVTGLTNGVNYCFKIFTRTGTSWSSGSQVCATPATVTMLAPGDIAVLGVCSNIAACVGGTSAGDDEISFVCFQDITTGTSFEMTDNGWERVATGLWGNTEGVVQATRTGGTIPAGTVITFRYSQAAGGTYTSVSPDANWTIAEIHGLGTDLIMNSGGDQIFFMQGGTWNYGTSGNHDATLTNPNILFGFNTNNVWSANGTTQHSNPFPGLECYSMMPGVATDYIKYTGVIDGFTAASQREWIRRINNPSNWTSYANCTDYYAGIPAYELGYSITINPGGFTDGKWLGTVDEDWFDCHNWESMRVPNDQTNVLIPSTGVSNEPSIGDPSATVYSYAECNDIDMQSGRTLTLNHANSRLDVSGDINFDGTLLHTNGIVRVIDDASSFDGSSMASFYNFEIGKNLSSQSLTLNQDIRVTNNLNLTIGKISTGTNRVIVTNTSTAAIIGGSQSAYIYGNLRRYVNSTGGYKFPVGSADYWEHALVTLNSSAGMSYIDAFFTTPHSTPINISGLGITVGGTLLEELLDYGFWTITPNAYSSVNYDIEITSYAHTNPGANPEDHAVIKRPNAASNWVSQGTHNNATQSMAAGYITAVRTSLTVFSDFAIAKANSGALPVELLSFTASPEKKGVTLHWVTASEVNNDYFTIERSDNAIHFYEIAYVDGAGNSNIELHYDLIDDAPLNGISYYRLKQTDFDGSISYSEIETVDLSNSSALDISQPFGANSTIQFYVYNASGISSIEVFDITGRTLYSQEIIIDDNHISIPNVFGAGTYILRFTNGNDSRVKKFVL